MLAVQHRKVVRVHGQGGWFLTALVISDRQTELGQSGSGAGDRDDDLTSSGPGGLEFPELLTSGRDASLCILVPGPHPRSGAAGVRY